MSSVTRFEFGSGEWITVTSTDSSHLTTPDEMIGLIMGMTDHAYQKY